MVQLAAMRHRALSLTLLTLCALQLLGGMAFASVCFEPCPDDAEGTSCPPVCVLCTDCTHAQTGIVQQPSQREPLLAARELVAHQPALLSSQLEDDIFHVPLAG